MMRFRVRLLGIAVLFTAPAICAAPNPPSGTLSEAAPVLTYTESQPLPASPSATSNNTCANDATSSIFSLSVIAPSTAGRSVKVEVAGVETADLVLTLRNATGNTVVRSADNTATGAPETIIIDAPATDTDYRVLVCLFAGAAAAYNATITLLDAPAPPPQPEPIVGAPRLTTLVAPAGMGTSAGEPSIGYNLKNRRAMYIAGLQTLRVTPAESSGILDAAGQALPLTCPANWTDVSTDLTGTTSLDPILFTNQSLGETGVNRTFVSQLTGSNSAFAFTDDDGANWTAGQIGASNGGVDHQTVGSGAYPAASVTFPGPPPGNPGYAVYYCSQSIVDAFCARSDTGGLTFNNGVPIGKATALGCATGDIGALHGHVRIAQDGSLAMPMKSCAGQQGFILSTDAGNTYSAKKVPGTTAGSTDPQLAWSKPGADGKIRGYFCMADGDGKPKATVTSDKGTTWSPLYDLGAAHNIKKAVFAQAIAGDADRAACAFIGTSTAGDSGALNFPGLWYGYVAYTFDGGNTWTTLNVTPGDPVQGRGGICTNGTTCGANRNLLDFNEITLDERGRVWFGYADGCISASCQSGEAIERAAKATIARQIGGKSLYAAFDDQIASIPQAPCLLGSRTAAKSSLSWITPDDGGQAITGYNVYRATDVTGPYVLLATVPVKNVFDDLTADADVASYFYKVAATYDGGEGLVSNVLELTISVQESVCTTPGITLLTDPANDSLDATAAHDVRALSIAQPYSPDDDYKILFHLKMTSLNPPTDNTFWPVNFCAPSFPCQDPNTAYGATNKYFTVRMTTFAPASSLAPGFELLQPTAGGTTAGSRTVLPLPTADGSNYTSGGLITMVVNAADLGLDKAGRGTDKLSKFQSRIGVNVGAGTITPDNMPDGLGGAGEFTTVEPKVCAPNTPPLADLIANPQSGLVPLTVQFTGSGTDDDVIDTIDTYSLDFGDGSTPVAQSDGAFPPHSYSAIGNYPARMFVVDSRGVRSSNTAEKIIVVYGMPVADAGADFAVDEGGTPMLSAANSDNANGGPLDYAWTQTAGPAVELDDADSATPSFATPAICTDATLSFDLRVTNVAGSDTDSVTITVRNVIALPVADAGADFAVGRARAATLDGSGSTYDACQAVAYRWEQTSGPAVALTSADQAVARFTAPDVPTDTPLVFRLTVTDNAGGVATDDVIVTVDSSVALIIGNNAVGGLAPLGLLILALFGALGLAVRRAS